MSSAILGEGALEGLVYTSFASTSGKTGGRMIAFSADSGEIVWEQKLKSYSWCSPLALYTASGRGYIVMFDHLGNLYLFDGLTGETVGTLKISENIEASPCAFGNLIVIGTRARHIYGIRVS